MAGRQQKLDYESPFNERMNVIRAKLEVVAAIAEAELDLKPHAWRLVREVLLAVYVASGADANCWSRKSDEELADSTDVNHQPLSLNQFRRYRTAARKLNLLTTCSQWGAVRQAGAWQVNLVEIDRLADLARRRLAAEPSTPERVVDQLASGTPEPEPRCEQVRTTANRCEQVRTSAKTYRKPPTPIPKPQPPPIQPTVPATALALGGDPDADQDVGGWFC